MTLQDHPQKILCKLRDKFHKHIFSKNQLQSNIDNMTHFMLTKLLLLIYSSITTTILIIQHFLGPIFHIIEIIIAFI